MSEGFEIASEREGLGFNPGLRVVHLQEFEEPYGMTGDERLAYRRRFTTLFVDEGTVRRGGLGRVQRATNALGEVFALKTLLAPEPVEGEEHDAFAARSERAKAAFRKEYEAQRSLSGFKGFPRLYGFAWVDDAPVIVMEWVDGVTLAQTRRELAVDERGRMAPLDAARLGHDLFELLTRLDLVGEGFVHRDISPSNVMLRTSRLSVAQQAEEGGFDLCLIDFGSSVPLDPAQDPLFTSKYASVRRATVAYAAPEMLSDDLPRVAQLRKSAAVDVYAAASALFELLSGELPFDVAEDGEVSPFRVKTDEQPATLVSAHNPAANMAELLPHEPEAAYAVARVMSELGTDLDPADACAALSRVDEQLADLVAVCLHPDQGKRPTAQAMCESLTAFCSNYAENVCRAVRGERLLPCTAGVLWNEPLSPYAVNRVVNTVGRAVAFALLAGVTAVTAILLDGLRASWSLGPFYWSGTLTAPVLAAMLSAPAALGFGVRALARRAGRSGVLPASIALGVSAVALCAVASGLSVRGMSEVNGLVYALIATSSAGWVPIVLDYAMMVIPALLMELRRMSAVPGAGGLRRVPWRSTRARFGRAPASSPGARTARMPATCCPRSRWERRAGLWTRASSPMAMLGSPEMAARKSGSRVSRSGPRTQMSPLQRRTARMPVVRAPRPPLSPMTRMPMVLPLRPLLPPMTKMPCMTRRRAMSPILSNDPTPCGAMFEMFKRYGGMSHKELASLVLSERPLSDGCSPLSRASDRTWLSRLVVNAPVGSLQSRYFRDFGMAAQRVMDRLRSSRRGEISSERIIDMVCGDAGKPMEYALAACHQDVTMYRNALDRFAGDESRTPGERAETVMVLFIAAACTANVPAAVAYANSYVTSVLGGRMRTPATLSNVALSDLTDSGVPVTALGLMRVANGYISRAPYWVDPSSEGAVIGSMAMGAHDITEVEADVSAEHARVWCEGGAWRVCDLGSRNGSRLLNGATGEEMQLVPDEPVRIGPGDELSLGAATTFMVVIGTVGAKPVQQPPAGLGSFVAGSPFR